MTFVDAIANMEVFWNKKILILRIEELEDPSTGSTAKYY